ncbi:hypothetical protein ADK70_01290 [Streptomyces rimosus subsp. pseudoverticillatus]|uniref:hypothetical protein n=1 Tax=Streptomyces rimosus TaxID=1927 RepID=UPI0006B2A541|nr:hypothetical protein [Streptomyces rimosus]KOU00203.1 hypothetical protein ADK70_01290 [Streptomyces rimosus subsp. pseudoverticillatus]
MRRLIAVPTALLALAVAGCAGGGPDDPTESSAASGSAPGASPTKSLEGSPSGDPGPSGGASPSGSAVPGQPLDCGALPDAMGEGLTARLFSGPGAGPTAGCAEARGVMGEFFRKATADKPALTVRGWECQYENGPTGTWLSSCRKDGGRQQMHTEEAGGSPPPDDPGQSEKPEGPGLPGGGEESQTSIHLPWAHV